MQVLVNESITAEDAHIVTVQENLRLISITEWNKQTGTANTLAFSKHCIPLSNTSLRSEMPVGLWNLFNRDSHNFSVCYTECINKK